MRARKYEGLLRDVAADQAAYRERDGDGDPSQGELTQAGSQQRPACEPANYHAVDEERDRRNAERGRQHWQAEQVGEEWRERPRENAARDEIPARVAEGKWNGSMPSSARVCTRTAMFGSSDTAAAILAAVSGSAP
jgi:hypothetical protein